MFLKLSQIKNSALAIIWIGFQINCGMESCVIYTVISDIKTIGILPKHGKYVTEMEGWLPGRKMKCSEVNCHH